MRPIILLTVQAEDVNHGDMMQLTVRFYNPKTLLPFRVRTAFIQILNDQGLEVWEKQPIRHNTKGFDILIGTSDMKPGLHTIRISSQPRLSPAASTIFRIREKGIIVGFPLFKMPNYVLPSPEVFAKLTKTVQQELLKILRTSPKQFRKRLQEEEEKMKDAPTSDIEPTDDGGPKPEQEPSPPEDRRRIDHFIYRTQMDHKVCPICLGYQDMVYQPDEWKPIIPDDTHPNCRCTYDVIWVDIKSWEASLKEQVVATEMVEVIKAQKRYERKISA